MSALENLKHLILCTVEPPVREEMLELVAALQPAEAASPPVAGGELPPLPEQAGWCLDMHGALVAFVSNNGKELGQSPGCTTPVFTAGQLVAYALATAARATRPAEAAGEAPCDHMWVRSMRPDVVKGTWCHKCGANQQERGPA